MDSTIIVPVDGSPRAEHALAPVAGLARRLGARVTLLMAGPPEEPDARAGYLEGLAATHGLAGATIVLDDGPPADAIVAALTDAEGGVLWLPTHARSGAALLALGGMAEQVLTRTTELVLLVGPDVADGWDAGADGPIVLSYDGSPGADAIVPAVCAWAERLGVPIHVTMVFHHDGEYLGDKVAAPARGEGVQLVHRLRAAGTAAEMHVLDGLNPATAVPRYANEAHASLIAAAAHTHRGLTHAALGSVAVRMARHASCPVLVRREPADD